MPITHNANLTGSVCEFVSSGHPDKIADQVSDDILDLLFDEAEAEGIPRNKVRSAVEVLFNGRVLIVGGEIAYPGSALDNEKLRAHVQQRLATRISGDPDNIEITIALRAQSPEIATLAVEGAGDQGIMNGYANGVTQTAMPQSYEASRGLITTYEALRESCDFSWAGPDAKSQVAFRRDGSLASVVLSVQHSTDISLEELRTVLSEQVICPVLGDVDPAVTKINAKGSFVLGGADADAGLTGRKIVVDQYGPSVAVGGGAFSGKDPSKVDRSAAYAARAIALDLVRNHPAGGEKAFVQIAYGIGQLQPEMVGAMLDDRDVSDWVIRSYPNLSPSAIQERLGLWVRDGWRYADTASGGHFGRSEFPWEQPFS